MDILSSLQNPGNLFKKSAVLNWGILGTSRIAEKTIIPAVKAGKNQKVLAVGSRSLDKAQAYAGRLEIPRAYGSYDELLADPEVQVVYIPLPNNEHAPWTLKALQEGKHVLVEKPFALNAREAREMVNLAQARNLVLMEAFQYRYNDHIDKLLERVRSGAIGSPRMMQVLFSFTLTNPNDFRLVPELGGGALYDIGTYCVNLMRLVAGREPVSVQGVRHDGNTGIDLQFSGLLDFGEQLIGSFVCAMNAVPSNSFRVVGDQGSLSLETPFVNEGAKARLSQDEHSVSTRGSNGPRNIVEHMYYAITENEARLYPLEDAIANMAVLDALFASAERAGQRLQMPQPTPPAPEVQANFTEEFPKPEHTDLAEKSNFEEGPVNG